MNNAYINKGDETVSDEALPIYRGQVTLLTELIEALNNIQGSSYWTVLKQNVFDVELEKAKRQLAKEKDTTEIFRLQGEIRWGERFDLVKLNEKFRNELSAIRKKL